LSDDDDAPIEKAVETISGLDFGVTSNGNDKVTISTESGREFWMFRDDWLDEVELRSDEYMGTRMEIYHRDVNGNGSFLIADYLWPADPFDQETWFERGLKARGLLKKLRERKAEQDTEALREMVSEIYD